EIIENERTSGQWRRRIQSSAGAATGVDSSNDTHLGNVASSHTDVKAKRGAFPDIARASRKVSPRSSRKGKRSRNRGDELRISERRGGVSGTHATSIAKEVSVGVSVTKSIHTTVGDEVLDPTCT